MKILKYILFAFLAIIILFLGMGLLNPSLNYGHEIIVDKPLEEAWHVTQDASKYDQWLAGYKSMELLEGKYNEVGSKYKVIVEPGDGQPPFEMIETVVAIDEYKHVELHFDSEFMDFEQKYIYDTVDGKTSVRSDAKVIAKGLMSRSMFAVMEKLGGSFIKQEKVNMEALKKVIEENMTDYSSAADKE